MKETEQFTVIRDALLQRMESDFSPEVIALWFEPLKIVAVEGDVIFFTVPSEFKRNYLQNKYADRISSYLSELLGKKAAPYFLLESDLKKSPAFEGDGGDDGEVLSDVVSKKSEQASSADHTEPLLPRAEEEEEEEEEIFSLSSEAQAALSKEPYSFDNFVVGTSNTLAYAASLAVAKQPSTGYNPLFIWGPSGLGKTHLLYAIRNYILATRPKTKIVYVKGEEFTNHLIESISLNRMHRFRNYYRQADVLLIDDIQFIAGKESTQEEFFHTFNTLYEAHKQIILTSDQPPTAIKTLEDRLRTRFVWGMTADIQPPDFELRQAILRKKADLFRVFLPPDVLEFLAENLKNNVRQLEGAIKRIGAQSLLTGRPISMDLAISCTADMLAGAESDTAVVDRILKKISSKYGISIEDLKSAKRMKQIAVPRHICIYLIRTLTSMSFPCIAKIFGRDHSTICSSYTFVLDTMKKDPVFEIEVSELTKEMRE